jgi:hypothetical protein
LSGRREAAGFLVLLLLLLCLVPPDGILSPNEENYFQLAAQSVSPAAVSPQSAVFDNAPHRFLADHLLGFLIAGLGYGGAQIVARLLVAAAYALALCAVFRRFGLDALDQVLVIVIFALLDQAMFGGEWLFHGAEAKVAAYILVLAGLALAIDGRGLYRLVPLFALATYFHFLVGIFWFASALALRLVEDRREFRRVAAAVGTFALLIAPLIAAIGWPRLDAAATVPPGMPSLDVIYSLLRLPHHTAPFLDGRSFIAHWLPGCCLAGGMLISSLVIAGRPEAARLRSMALWLALMLLYLAMAFGAAAVDRRTGVLGKFYLFRPAALILLLWLTLMVAALGRLGPPHWRKLRWLALALVLPSFLLHAASRITRDLAASRQSAKPELAALLQRQPAGAVLIDPTLEPHFYDIERVTSHPALVLWKFIPTDDRDMVEWYRRLAFRDAIFARGCAAMTAYPVVYLLATPRRAEVLAATCGAVIGSAGPWVLLRRG